MGIPSIPTVTVADESAAVSAADRVGYPVALKAVGPVHKTESGGVALDLSDAAAVSAAWRAMRARLGAEMTRGIVQPMARPGVETIAGVVQDRLFGPLLLFGLGGTSAELLQDRAVRLVPLTRPDATALVTSLRGSPLLTGYRGSTPVDRTALEDLLLRLSLLAEAVPEIAEIDCNPVVARPEGVEVLDARVRVAPPPPP